VSFRIAEWFAAACAVAAVAAGVRAHLRWGQRTIAGHIAAYGALGLPRIARTPTIQVELIGSSASPGGVSGLGPAVLAPAVANAIAAGTGRRLRRLPFDLAAAA
jgi:hypothetical protein